MAFTKEAQKRSWTGNIGSRALTFSKKLLSEEFASKMKELEYIDNSMREKAISDYPSMKQLLKEAKNSYKKRDYIKTADCCVKLIEKAVDIFSPNAIELSQKIERDIADFYKQRTSITEDEIEDLHSKLYKSQDTSSEPITKEDRKKEANLKLAIIKEAGIFDFFNKDSIVEKFYGNRMMELKLAAGEMLKNAENIYDTILEIFKKLDEALSEGNIEKYLRELNQYNSRLVSLHSKTKSIYNKNFVKLVNLLRKQEAETKSEKQELTQQPIQPSIEESPSQEQSQMTPQQAVQEPSQQAAQEKAQEVIDEKYTNEWPEKIEVLNDTFKEKLKEIIVQYYPEQEPIDQKTKKFINNDLEGLLKELEKEVFKLSSSFPTKGAIEQFYRDKKQLQALILYLHGKKQLNAPTVLFPSQQAEIPPQQQPEITEQHLQSAQQTVDHLTKLSEELKSLSDRLSKTRYFKNPVIASKILRNAKNKKIDIQQIIKAKDDKEILFYLYEVGTKSPNIFPGNISSFYRKDNKSGVYRPKHTSKDLEILQINTKEDLEQLLSLLKEAYDKFGPLASTRLKTEAEYANINSLIKKAQLFYNIDKNISCEILRQAVDIADNIQDDSLALYIEQVSENVKKGLL